MSGKRQPRDTAAAGDELELLCQLLRRRSVTPDDAGCQQLLAERLRRNGFRCESMPFGEVTNLWARHGNERPLLCFAGHTDVVPPGNDDEWRTDPFDPVIVDDMLYGRGAADMKSGLAAMIVAAERFVARYPQHAGSLAFLITSDEEGRARDGTLKVVETLGRRGEQIDWCVIGEPSSQTTLGDIVRNGRRGSLSGMLTVRGTQGHVAYPQLADNPIRRFAPVLAALHDIEWDQGNAHFPPTSFQVVDVRSSSGAVNVTPAELSARFNFRYSTEWSHTQLREKVESVLAGHDLEYELKWHLSGEPFLTEAGRLTEAVCAAVREISGSEPELSTGGGTSDGRFISPAGADVVELGPVNESIHKVNEHVRLTDVTNLRRMYERIMALLLA
ncbi:MAG: succinyl-diaminopimelate desuccinylase [Gammaproteobacteria bacterium]|nr:succinyl-diaminopimelate desuccinylase [Gammaproteobacteria bacterium]